MGERLLFVDDDLEILEINRKYFETCGYHADTATDAWLLFPVCQNTRISVLFWTIYGGQTDSVSAGPFGLTTVYR